MPVFASYRVSTPDSGSSLQHQRSRVTSAIPVSAFAVTDMACIERASELTEIHADGWRIARVKAGLSRQYQFRDSQGCRYMLTASSGISFGRSRIHQARYKSSSGITSFGGAWTSGSLQNITLAAGTVARWRATRAGTAMASRSSARRACFESSPLDVAHCRIPAASTTTPAEPRPLPLAAELPK